MTNIPAFVINILLTLHNNSRLLINILPFVSDKPEILYDAVKRLNTDGRILNKNGGILDKTIRILIALNLMLTKK